MSDATFDAIALTIGWIISFFGTWIAATVVLGPIGLFFGWIPAYFFAALLCIPIGYLTLLGLFLGTIGLLYWALTGFKGL